jgi:hypothetical protein
MPLVQFIVVGGVIIVCLHIPTGLVNTIFVNLGESSNFGSIFVSVKHFYTPSFSFGMIVFHCISFKQNHYNNIKSEYRITVNI